MTIIFATNDLADFPGGILSTTAGDFRSAYVSSAIQVSDGNSLTPIQISSSRIPPVAGDVTWLHFQYRKEINIGNANADGNMLFELVSGTGVKIMDFDVDNAILNCRLFGSSTLTTAVTGNGPSTGITAFDIKIDLTSDITIEVWINQALVHDESQAWTSSPGNPEYILWRGFDIDSGGTPSKQWVSELIVADEDTQNMGLSEMIPDAAGNYSAWKGDHVETGDNDLGTGASSSSTGQKLSSDLSSFGGPSSSALRALVILNKASTRGGTVGDLRNFLRIGGADFNGAALGVGETIKNYVTVYDQNPDTSSDWDTTDFAGVEIGIESLA